MYVNRQIYVYTYYKKQPSLTLPLIQVNVFGFGADSRGNWHHYWEQNRYSGEFRKTGVHDADYEAQIIQRLAQAGKITVFPGK